ncbi:MAG: hypothetical protein RIR84_185, partial [Bacteroidota bacterium]
MIMKKITYTLSVALVATLFVVLASSCNKNVPEAVPKSFY